LVARYGYIWKTDPSWANGCRSLLITLKDGSQHEALFKFSR
jgi:extracellular elastinolytic metalloproteinase